MNRRWQIRIAIFAIAAPVTIGAGVFIGLQGVHLSQAQIDSAIDTGLQRYEDKIRSSLPQQVDPYTKLIGVHHIKKMITYTYEVSNVSGNIEQSLIAARLKRDQLSNSCKVKEVRFSLDNGVTFRYIYEDGNGSELLHFEIAKIDCIKAETAETI
jgi:hypothetical protein